MSSSAPAYTIGGLTRPALNFDSTGHILLEGPVAEFAAQYGLQALYLGLPPGVPFPPIPCILGTPVDSNGSANTVAEGAAAGTQVGLTVSASHTAFLPLTYSLIGDSSGGGFKIDPSTGVVTVADPSKIDFESSAGHAYTVTARASDGIISTSQTFTIGVTDVAPSTPVDSNGATNTVAEGAAANTLVGITAAATDINGGAITWSLSADSSGGGFKINPTTGVISVADPTKIDYESTAPGHSYTVTASASDGTLSSSQSFTIAVTDVAPSAPTDTDPAANSVAEGAANGSTVGLTASSVDPNGPPTTYILTDNAGGRFAINPTTGVVTVANGAAIDYETASGHSYNITVQATAGAQNTTQTFAIGVTDVAPSAPTDSNPAANTVFEMAANNTAVGLTASSFDPGGGPPATYSLTDSAGGRFAIDPGTGVVTVANGAAIDYETAPGPGHSYGITVQATAGALSSTQTFSIGVANVNEAPAGTDNTVTTLEDTPYVFAVADFGFTDPSDSSAPNSLFAVKMTTVPSASAGTLTNNGTAVNAGDFISASDIAAGHLVLTPALNANGSPEAGFTFQVQDNGGTANGGVDLDQSPNTLTINVTPVNDPPGFAVGANQTALEDSGAHAVNGFVTGISPGPADEAGQAVNFIVSNDNHALFSVAPSIDAAGNLTYTLAANANGSATVTVQAHDNGGTANGGSDTSVAQTFKIDVTPVNDAPTFTVGGDQSVLEDSGAQTVNGFVTAISPGPADESGQTLNFLVSNNNNALFSVQPSIDVNGNLSYTPAANANGSATVSVMLHDNGGTANGGVDTSAAQTFTIQVPAVNDPPSFTIGANQVTLEDSGAHTFNGFITGISPGPSDESGQAVNFLVSNDNNALFSVAPSIDSSGNLTYTLAANANGATTVTVQAHDNGGTANGGIDTSAAQTFTITATPVNDAPAGADNTLTTLEDTAHTFTAAEFGFTDPVDGASASGPNALQAVVITTTPGAAGTLTDNGVTVTAGSSVTIGDINSGLFKFTPAANANGAAEASFTFQVRDDGGTANGGVDTDPSANTITFNVTSVNDAPAGTDKTIIAQGAHTFVTSDFGFTDPNDTPSNNLLAVKIATLPGSGTLTDNGSPVNAGDTISLADITGGHLVFTPSGNSTGSFTFQVQDDGGTGNGGVDLDPTPNTFTINQDVPPVVTAGHTLNYTENQAATAIDPALTVTDSDSANLASATVQITGNYVNGEDLLGFTTQNGITGSFNAATGTLTLTGSSSVANYQTALDSVTYFNTSDNPSGATRTVTIITNDGTLDSTAATDTINVTPVNDAPVVTAGHTLNYTENQAATALDPAIAVTDVDSANLASATVQITGNYVNGQDVLGFTNQNGITGSFNAATGTLTLNGSSSVANYQAALDSVTYFNTSDNPSGLARTVTIIANDGAANSIAKTDTINVTPVNDAPVTAAGGTLNYTENQAATAIDATVTVSDVDSANLSSATVQISGNYVNGQDILGFTTQNGITGSFDAASGTMALTGSSSVANYQTALESVTYFNNSDNPSGADRTVSYTVNDGSLNSNTSTSTIHVTPVNDAPVVTATGTLAYTENQAATAIAPALTVTDVDNTTLASASVQISANYVNGEDVLGFTDTANITGTFNAATGTMTLTGTDTVANYQSALRSVTYSDTSENPSTSARTVTFTADDGQSANHLSAGSNHTITVASVDDAPTVTVPGAQDSVSAHTDTAISGISTNDVDAGALAVKVSLGTTHGNITLDLSGGATLADATTNGTHSVHITGTLTQVNAALSSLIYHGDAGFTGADALTVQTNDLGHTGTGGPLSSSVATVNIGVIPKVWFIDNTAPAVGADGSQAHPFNSIAAFNAINDGGANHPQTNDYIYLKTGTGIYSETDGIHLLNGQQLVGGGDSLTFTDPLNNANTLTIATAGTRPVIDVTGGAGNEAIHLAQDNTVHGFNIATENAAATGIADNGGTVGTLNISNMDVGIDPDGVGALSGNLGQAISITHGGTGGSMTFGTVSSGGGANGIALGGALVTTFSATGGTLSGHSVSEFSSSGGSGNVSYGGALGDGTGLSATINNRTGGTVTLSGNITDGADTGGGIGISGNANTTVNFSGTTKTLNTGTGDGVSITNNTGSTVNFTNGGLTVQTSNGTAFQDTVAGTVSVTGSGNTLATSGTGAILNMSDVGLGASGVTFGSLQSTGASVGATAILLNNVDGNTFTSGGTSIAGTSGAGNDGIRISGGSSSAFNFNGTTTVSNTANDGINLSGANGAVSFNSVALNGMGGDGIDVSGNINSVTVSGGSIGNSNDPAGVGVRIATGTADVSIAASITKSSAGHVVDVSGHTGGTVGFSGAISGTGAVDDGISLTSNTGATMNFSGGMTLTTGANSAFNATGGGTVNVTNGANNHLTTTTGTALNISNTTIGASNVTFHDINANGAANGIVLNTTGTSGHLTVTGGGSTAAGGDNSGGTIQSTTGAGISLTNTSAVSLTNIHVTNTGGDGIAGTTVNGFTLANSKVDGANGGSAVNQGSIYFTGLTGTASITNSTIKGGHQDNVSIADSSGTLDLTISGNTIRDTDTGTNGNDNLFVQANGNANITSHIENNTFAATNGDHYQANTIDQATQTLVFTGNTLSGGGGVNAFGQGITISGGNSLPFASTEHVNFNISSNTMTGTIQGGAINVNEGAGNGTWQGEIGSNTVGNAAIANSGATQSSAIRAENHSASGTMTVVIDGNSLSQYNGVGINLQDGDAGNATNTAVLNATVTNNTETNPGPNTGTPAQGLTANIGPVAGATNVAFLNIQGNHLAEVGGVNDIHLRERNSSTIHLQGYTGASGDTTAVVNFEIAQNPGNTADASANANGYLGGTTPTPTVPSLMAAAGGVQASSPTPGEMNLTLTELDSVVAAAIGQWAHAGATGAQLAALWAITFDVADLSGNTLGEESPGHVTIDTSAAGHGWFVDPTPSDNSEFTHAANAAGTDLFTDPTNPAAGHIDLLTTVTHEMGHVLGLPDMTAPADDLMYISLVDGERRLPDAADVAQASASAVTLPTSVQSPAGGPIVVGTAGNDVIDAGFGGKILFGGAGADSFVFGPAIHLATPAMPAAQPLTHVADYSAAQGDTLDFSALTSAFHNWNISDASMVRVVEDQGGTFAMVQINTTPAAPMQRGVAAAAPHWVNVAQLDGAHSGDAVNVLVDSHGAAHLAHLHADLLV